MKILYLPKFSREYKRLSEAVKAKAEQQEKIFRGNPFDKRLKTHKLQGELSGFWAFSIDFQNRIVFDFVDENTVRFYRVGSHDVYDV